MTAAPLAQTWVLRLYVAGSTAASARVVQRAKALFDAQLPDGYELAVVDLYQQPELAEQEDIMAVPTLIRCLPLPRLTLIGDLSDTGRLVQSLGLDDLPAA